MKKETQKKLDKYQNKIGKQFKIKNSPVGYGILTKIEHRGRMRGWFTILDSNGHKTAVSVLKEMSNAQEI